MLRVEYPLASPSPIKRLILVLGKEAIEAPLAHANCLCGSVDIEGRRHRCQNRTDRPVSDATWAGVRKRWVIAHPQ